ncbi:MAG: hypothetical protein EOO01_11555 [Chitinophagaceae bacterium]|nr:MAG: hypothetical protein EOO01_11555 [Chitinophagaceae bacterium]
MADLMSILSSNYATVGANTSPTRGKYVNVNPEAFQGRWTGKYANSQSFEVQVSNVVGFRAKVKYQSGAITKYQDVLIKDNAFRVGDTKFVLTRAGTAQVNTVVTNPATGASTLEKAYAKQNS